MSVFESIYDAGHPNPNLEMPSPAEIEKNYDCATCKRDQDAVQITDSLLKNRFSCRYYLPKPVPKEIIEEIIDAARFAPSGNNMQPWEKVYCITGEVLKTISADMVQAHKEHADAYSSQYHYYPTGPIPPQYAKRRYDFGKVFYAPLHIDHDDLAGRKRISTRNYEFFDAPVAFIFTINQALTQGSWLDTGFFLQSMIIAARARGLETVAQESTSKYQMILRKHLPIGENEVVALGMSMGYPDLEKIAQFSARQSKRTVAEIVHFDGF